MELPGWTPERLDAERCEPREWWHANGLAVATFPLPRERLRVVRKPRFAPRQFRPIRFRPAQLIVAKAVRDHDRGMGHGMIVGRARFSPRQQMNATDGKRAFFPRS